MGWDGTRFFARDSEPPKAFAVSLDGPGGGEGRGGVLLHRVITPRDRSKKNPCPLQGENHPEQFGVGARSGLSQDHTVQRCFGSCRC